MDLFTRNVLLRAGLVRGFVFLAMCWTRDTSILLNGSMADGMESLVSLLDVT